MRKDRLIPLKYLHGGQVWIPKEAACGGNFPVVVLLHGNNPKGRKHKYLGGGKKIDEIARRYLDRGQIRPLILASPIHHAVCKKEDKRNGLELLWSHRFSFKTYRRLLEKVLKENRIRASSWSLIGHSGAGCCPMGGLFAAAKVWKKLKIWATADTCYENPVLAGKPKSRFSGTRTVVYNACRGTRIYPGYPRYRRLLFTDHPRRAACDTRYYRDCIRHPRQQWFSFVTKRATVPGHSRVVIELAKTILWRHFPSKLRRLAERSRVRHRRRRMRHRTRARRRKHLTVCHVAQR